MNSRHIYRHFCMMARALEVVGERWSLLIVRDLLLGPRRFTDLVRGLAEITPTRLTERLRQLEAVGIVARERTPAGREVWYRLTEAGSDLGPVVEALTLWGIEHALEDPSAGEPVYPVPAMIGTKVWLSRHAALLHPVSWGWRFPGDDSYTLSFDDGTWTLSRGGDTSSTVSVEVSPETWARLLTAPRGSRRLPGKIHTTGKPDAIKEFAEAFSIDLGSR